MTIVNAPVRTERLLLRLLCPDDTRPLFALFADWEVIRWLSNPPWPYTLDDARAFVERQLEDKRETDFFAITLEGALIGGIGLRTNAPASIQRGPGPNLGYWLGRPYWGSGYMTEAARALLGQVFLSGASQIVYSGAFAGNEASLRVQTKLGFERDGETTLFSTPHRAKLPHINTLLTIEAFRTHMP